MKNPQSRVYVVICEAPLNASAILTIAQKHPETKFQTGSPAGSEE